MIHKQFLLAALQQASLGRGFCAPNPSVGAVAVRNGEIIAKAFHKGAGTAHAEVLIFEQIPPNMDDVVLYVTLEPCNHWGRTPPCVNAIINHGIKHVVYGYRDPNPTVVANDSPTILKEHGIESLYFPTPEIDAFYESYTHWRKTGKPFVTAKIAQSLDGKIAKSGGVPCKISNALCDEFTHQQRMKTDIILTSARTINQDNPLLNARVLDKEYAKPLAIIDTKLSLNPQSRIFNSTKYCHIYCKEINKMVDTPKKSYHVVSSNAEGLILAEVITHLGELGYHDLWVEAGGTLFEALHRANLVDRTYLYIAPTILGPEAINAYSTNFMHQAKSVDWVAMGDNVMACLNWEK